MAERPIQHREPDKKDDDALRREARAHLAGEPALQLAAELIARLRELGLPWWTPVRLRERWGAVERMRWLRERSDLRQQITTSLTGLAPRAARRKTPDFQGALVDSVIDEGDITPRAFEDAFDPCDLAVYGPASAYWHFFRESMPWDEDTPVHQELLAWLLKSLLADRSPFDGIGRAPILTPWDVRTAIDGRVWHTRVPLEIRVAIDEARFQQERDRPGVPFHAEGDLAIAAPEIIAASVPLRELVPVLVVAQKSMRFDPPRGAVKLDNGKGLSSEAPSRARDVGTPSSPPGRPAGAGLGVYDAVAPKASSPPLPPPLVTPGSVPPGPMMPSPPASPGAAPPAGPVVGTPLHGGPPAGSAPPPAGAASPAGGGAAAQPARASYPPPAQPASPPRSGPDGVAPPPLVDPTRMAPLPPPTPDISVTGGAAAGAPRTSPPPSGSGASAVLAVLNSIDSSEEELERTNPWTVPSPEEIAAASARLPPEGTPEAAGKRRRSKA